MSVYQEFLIWSCSIGDEALLDIFWKRTPNPIKSAVMDDIMAMLIVFKLNIVGVVARAWERVVASLAVASVAAD